MPKRMRGTSKTVCSVHTEQTYDHTVHTERTLTSHCEDTCLCRNHDLDLLCFMATQFNTLQMHLSMDLLLVDVLIFVKIIKEIILCAEGTCNTGKCEKKNTLKNKS